MWELNSLGISYSTELVNSLHPLIGFLRRSLAVFIVVTSDMKFGRPVIKIEKKNHSEQVNSPVGTCYSGRENEAINSVVWWLERWLCG